MSGKYMVSFELPGVDPDRVALDVAYAAAQRVVMSGLAAFGYSTDMPITVACPAEPVQRTETRWLVEASGHPVIHPKRSLALAFDVKERRAVVLIMDDEPAEPAQYRIYLRPRQTARIVRALMAWPLDMLEAMAAEDEAKRRRRGDE